MLKTQLSTEQSTVSTLQSLNAKFAALATKAARPRKPDAWSALKATSSSAGRGDGRRHARCPPP